MNLLDIDLIACQLCFRQNVAVSGGTFYGHYGCVEAWFLYSLL
jgi:hypothetical protein